MFRLILISAFIAVSSSLPQAVEPESKSESEEIILPVIDSIETKDYKSKICHHVLSFTNVGSGAFLESMKYPEEYSPNTECTYYFDSPPKTQIRLYCEEFNVEGSPDCVKDRLSFSLSGDKDFFNPSYACGKGILDQTSIGNTLTIKFNSDSSNVKSTEKYKYKCKLEVIKAPPPPPVTTNTTDFSCSGLPIDDKCVCGVRNEIPRIVGGEEAKPSEFPWVVSVINDRMGPFCVGTICSRNYVMTAAHCTNAVQKNESLFVIAGDHDLGTNGETRHEVLEVEKIIQHPKYNNKTQDNDISLLKLKYPLVFRREISPVCMPCMDADTLEGKTVIAHGWGTTSSGGFPSYVLQKTELTLVITEKCKNYYPGAITNNMMCTYNPGRDTCQGDSGGTIDYKDPTTAKYCGIGVVSWGVGCAGENKPGVYTKVQNYIQWIREVTAGEKFCKASSK